MNEQKRRIPIFHVSKYQKHIILLAMVPLFVLSYFFSCIVLYFSSEIIRFIIDGVSALSIELVKRWLVLTLLSMWIAFVFVLIWVYKSSGDLVGAFTRVIRELDEINDGERKGPIHVRDDDHLAKDILDRVNVLLDKVDKK